MAGWALCMTLVLAALAGSVSCQTYQAFLQKHVDYPPTSVNPPHLYCDIMMQRRNINKRAPCKPLNTFVNEPAQSVKDACSQTPDAAGHYTTPTRLDITNCRVRPGSTWPNCQYQNQQVQRFVVVNCNANGEPVHLDNTHP